MPPEPLSWDRNDFFKERKHERSESVMLHLIYVGVLFLFDGDLIEKTKREPWYTGTYLALFIITLVQYFITSGSSSGYALDAMRTVNEANSIFRRTAAVSKQPASSKGSVVVTVEGSQLERPLLKDNGTPWSKFVLDLYSPGTSVSGKSAARVRISSAQRKILIRS